MKRFVYAPDVQVYISTQDHGIVDVSGDVVNGSVNRVLNAASTATLTLNSPNRKYLRIFRPMDRIAIYLTRIKPVLVFTGYLDRSPLDQLYPGPITLNASCPIKRLLYTFWDPALSYTQSWFAAHGWSWDVGTGQIFPPPGQSLWNLDLDGTIGHMMRQVLHDVGGWPIGQGNETRNTVHILGLPKQFLSKTQSMIANASQANEQQQASILKFMESLLTVNGIYSAPFSNDNPNTNPANFTSTQTDDNPLPANLAKSYHASIYGGALPIAGIAGAIIKEAAKDGISLDTAQAQAASTIFTTVTNAGYTSFAAAGWIAAAYGESTLIPDRAQSGGGGGSGLFQLTSSNFFGTSGILAAIAKQNDASYSGNPQPIGSGVGDNGAAAANAGFNVLAILHNAIVGDPTSAVNSAADPLSAVVHTFLRPADGGTGDVTRGTTIMAAVQRAITSAASSTNQQPSSNADTGNVGDVRVGDPGFIVAKPPNVPVGYTFEIKDNPFGNDSMIFRAVKYDSSLDPQEIQIYVPGADDKSSPQAQGWTNKVVAVETSINQANRFSTTNSSTPFSGSGVVTGPTGPNAGTIATKVIQIAIGEVGTKESGYNAGPQVDKYLAAAHLSPGQPWCVAFVQWVFQQAGRPLTESGLSGSTGTVQAAYPNTNDPQPGDIITWSDSHTGLVVKRDGDTYYTVEGNAGNNSDAVVENQRSLANPTAVDGILQPTFNRVSGIGLAAPDANIPSNSVTDPTTSTTIGGTGVQFNQQTIAQISASTSEGLALTFPLVSSAVQAADFTGERALQNDVALIDWVKFMTTAAGRQFQTLPNGDFMAFYPDYFNWSAETPYWIISDIETMDLTIDISDETMATHVFTTADSFSPNGQIDLDDQLNSTVASIESLNTFRDLVGVGPEFDPVAFMKRYGARPMTEEVVEIKNSFLQFMYGWMTFLKQWASMFYATPTFTFMPELYPGGLVEFKSKDLVMFINSVTHSFDRTSGFTTSAELIAPSTRTKQYSFPMVLTGGFQQASAKSASATGNNHP